MVELADAPGFRPCVAGPALAPVQFSRLWRQAERFPAFIEQVRNLESLWLGVYRNAVIPEWAHREYARLGPGLKLLVINADWCVDSATTIPVLARLAERVPGVELRLLERDRHPGLMECYLTGGTRSIPVVILLDREYRELGHWGPRPAELQEWVRTHLEVLPKEERLKAQRRWYAKDKGESVLREVLEVVTRAEDGVLSLQP